MAKLDELIFELDESIFSLQAASNEPGLARILGGIGKYLIKADGIPEELNEALFTKLAKSWNNYEWVSLEIEKRLRGSKKISKSKLQLFEDILEQYRENVKLIQAIEIQVRQLSNARPEEAYNLFTNKIYPASSTEKEEILSLIYPSLGQKRGRTWYTPKSLIGQIYSIYTSIEKANLTPGILGDLEEALAEPIAASAPSRPRSAKNEESRGLSGMMGAYSRMPRTLKTLFWATIIGITFFSKVFPGLVSNYNNDSLDGSSEPTSESAPYGSTDVPGEAGQGFAYPPDYKVITISDGLTENYTAVEDLVADCNYMSSCDPKLTSKAFMSWNPSLYPYFNLRSSEEQTSTNTIFYANIAKYGPDTFSLMVNRGDQVLYQKSIEVLITADDVWSEGYDVRIPIGLESKYNKDSSLKYIDGKIFDSNGRLLWDNGILTDDGEISEFSYNNIDIKFLRGMRLAEGRPSQQGVAGGFNAAGIQTKVGRVVNFSYNSAPELGQAQDYTFWCLTGDEPNQRGFFKYLDEQGNERSDLACQNGHDGTDSATGQFNGFKVYYFATSLKDRHFTVDDLVASIKVLGGNENYTSPGTIKFTAWTYDPDQNPAERRISTAYATCEITPEIISAIGSPQECRFDMQKVFADLPPGTIFDQLEMEFINTAYDGSQGVLPDNSSMLFTEFGLYHKASSEQSMLPISGIFGGLMGFLRTAYKGGTGTAGIKSGIAPNLITGADTNEEGIYIGKKEFMTGRLEFQVVGYNVNYKVNLFEKLGLLDVINEYYSFPDRFKGDAGYADLKTRIEDGLSKEFITDVHLAVGRSNLYQWLNINRYKIEPPERRAIVPAPRKDIVPYESPAIDMKTTGSELNIGTTFPLAMVAFFSGKQRDYAALRN